MIIKFGFSNFKSIYHPVELSFEASTSDDLEEYYVVRPTPKLRLLKMAAIYGANASGKSNVLEALDFLRKLVVDPALKKTDKIEYDRFAFDEEARNGNSEFSLNFVQNGVRYDYSIKLNPKYILEESLYFYNPNKALVYSRTTEAITQLSSIVTGSKIKITSEDRRILEANTLWNSTVLGSYLKLNLDFPILQAVTKWFGTSLQGIIKPNSNLLSHTTTLLRKGAIDKKNLVLILKKADFNIADISLLRPKDSFDEMIDSWLEERKSQNINSDAITVTELKGGDLIEFKHSISGKEGRLESHTMPFKNQSLGTQRFFQFAGILDLMIRQQKIYAIDEIESSLHPELLKHFLLLFLRNSKNSQLIFTTHQREFMRETDMLRNDIFHFTEKGEDGSTEIYSFTDFDSSVIRKGSSLYNAYKIGKLGATPELEDAYIPVD